MAQMGLKISYSTKKHLNESGEVLEAQDKTKSQKTRVMEDNNNMIRCFFKFALKEIGGFFAKCVNLSVFGFDLNLNQFELMTESKDFHLLESLGSTQIQTKSQVKKRNNTTFTTIVVVQDIFGIVIHHNKQCCHVMSTIYNV